MQERIHLVHGSFSVESKPWQGTKIIATVPLVAEREWSPEDGDVKETTSVTGIGMRRTTILLADDHTMICAALQKLLEPELK